MTFFKSQIAGDHGIITVNAFILSNNKLHKTILAFDTGAYLTLIDPEIADLLGFSENDSTGPLQISSPIGIEKGYKIKVDRFEFCKKSINNFELGVIPISNRFGIDGLLGLNFLDKFNLNINFQANSIELVEF